MSKVRPIRRIFGVAALGVAGMTLMMGTPRQALAVTCPCAPACAICVQCVNSSVSTYRSIANGLFSSLDASYRALDQAIETGLEAENNAINYAGKNIIDAQNAHAMSVTSTIELNSVMEQRLLEGIKSSLEALAKSGMLAENNYRTASDYGAENVSRGSNISRNFQMAEAVKPSRADQQEKFAGDESGAPRVTSDFMIETAQHRAIYFLDEILRLEHGQSQELELAGLFAVYAEGGLHDIVLREESWNDGVVMRRALVIPRGIQAGLRQEDLIDGTDSAGYWRIVVRARTAAYFLAWEMALRSEIGTTEGKTSLLNYIKHNVMDAYANTDAMITDVSRGDRTLLNTIAANEAMGNLIDMLLLEAENYGNAIEAAKLGVYTDEAFNPYYGYNNVLDSTVGSGAIRGE